MVRRVHDKSMFLSRRLIYRVAVEVAEACREVMPSYVDKKSQNDDLMPRGPEKWLAVAFGAFQGLVVAAAAILDEIALQCGLEESKGPKLKHQAKALLGELQSQLSDSDEDSSVNGG